MRDSDQSKVRYDIVVFGATSFVGKIVCRYLLRHYGASGSGDAPKWALAARSATKLNALLEELASEGLNTKNLNTMVADSSDEASLIRMCRQTKVLVSTVGPYALYGEPLVKVCATLGTDYCDLTGETPWVASMIGKYDEAAKTSGARIVHCCGFDSIPSDMGVWFLQNQAKKQFDAPCNHVKMRVKKMKGTASGGTIASLINVVKEASNDKSLRTLLNDPYSMCPANFSPKTKQENHYLASYDNDFNVWIAPFIMAGVNTRVVFRSNALIKGGYAGKSQPFTYSEAMMMGTGTLGQIKATQFSVGLGGFTLAAAVKPSRMLMQRFLPAPGEGPSLEAQEAGYFDLRFFGSTPDGKAITIRVTGDKDPGYGSTAKMLSQAALCFLHIPKEKKPGGFWTPATLFGNTLLKRLQTHAGLTFTVL
jgi:short subunit dehydrogenase-like uncharacterized protein